MPTLLRWLPVLGSAVLFGACAEGPDASGEAPAPSAAPAIVRVATYNIEDVRGDDLLDPDHPRLRAAAVVIQRLRPDILLINEIAYGQPGAPGYDAAAGLGQNARRFVEAFLSVPQADALEPITYSAFTAPTNTGIASGFDFDRSGAAVRTYPEPPPAEPDGRPGAQTPEGRLYGNDSFGFGTFPGQYGMALLVRDGFEILRDSVRTFRLLPWAAVPDNLMPSVPETGEPWYAGEAGEAFRLSSKSHWDVPVRLPNGAVLHVLASHPTPPGFDGPEQRNVRRNRDEIRLWADYLSGADYLVDDSSRAGGLPPDAPFVIVGDQNADPDEGSSYDDAIRLLLDHPRVNGAFVPVAKADAPVYPDLDPDDTATWGLRADYVLPSANLDVLDGGVLRLDPEGPVVSDHFPVWLDVRVPAGGVGE